jgi:tRNA threonylcarbamoyladenosine biosynthesis protein TsaB
MKLLGIETATHICGAALTIDETLVMEYRSGLKNAHGRLLTPAISGMLADAGWRSSDLDAVAVSIGPGSFTGLRIGLALAKGLALAHNLPVAAVPTLEALTAQAPVAEGLIAALLRSRADEYYCGLYERRPDGDHIHTEPRVILWHELASAVPPEAVLISAAPLPGVPTGWRSTALHHGQLSGYTIARLGYRRLLAGEAADADLVEPLYLQDFIVGRPKPPVLNVGSDVS